MTRSIRVLLLAAILLTLSCQSVHVNSPGNPGNPNPGNPNPGSFTAASCSYADVSDCINGTGANTCHLPGGSNGTHTASNGDTIIIPAGSCIWTSALQISVLLHFLGSDPTNTNLGACTGQGSAGDNNPNCGSAGGGQTVLIDNVDKSVCGTASPMISFNNESQGNEAMEVGNLTIQGLAPDPDTCSEHIQIHTGSHALRIHDNTFLQTTSAGVLVDGDEWGVFDHNSFPDTGASCTGNNPSCHQRGIIIHHSRWQESGDYGDNSWFQADTMGTQQAFFVENNVFNLLKPESSSNAACEYGGRCVMRYNDMEWTGTHGTESSERNRSIRHFEIYNNNIRDRGQTITGGAILYRGGTGMVFNNTVTRTLPGNYAVMTSTNAYRRTGITQPWGPSGAPWNGKGGCFGNSPWDTNDRGGTHYSGTATSGSATDSLVDSKPNFGGTNNLVGYSIVNMSNAAGPWGSNITSNTPTSITTDPAALGAAHNWTTGDSYQVMRATQCIDQPGVGAGILLSGNPPTPASAVNNAIDPLYAAGNQLCNPTCSLYTTVVFSKFGDVIANRNYYDQLGVVGNGTTGTGQGTLEQRPATCTPKVGYWATDTNTLYQCESTNTWVPHYTPFTYPHPLVSTSP
jgi:hypothetical protein